MTSLRSEKHRGFTLIELMVTVAIVGILAAIAYPSYTSQVAKGRRADARTQLVSGQQWLEKFYSENYSYATDSSSSPATATFNVQPFTQSPRAGEGSAVYTITLNSNTTSYTLTAAPISTGPMYGDTCGSLIVTNTGRRSTTSSLTAAQALEKCWK